MADLTKEVVTVGYKSKFGFKSGNNWYNPDKPLNVSDFQDGATVEVLTYAGKKEGSRRIKELLSSGSVSETEAKDVIANLPEKKNVSTKPEYKGRDFDAEARGKVYNNLAASLATSPYLAGSENDDDFIERIDRIALKLAELTFKYQKGQ